jgi:hypothetical protein
MTTDPKGQYTSEFAWVIERYHNSRLLYWAGWPETSAYAWSPDNLKAVRFLREEDATGVLVRCLDGNGRVAQHGWDTGAVSFLASGLQAVAGSCTEETDHAK